MNDKPIRTAVRSLYDIQKLRIQQGNRIAAAFRVKLGLDSSQAEETNPEAHDILEELRCEYKRITDGIKKITCKIRIDSPLITSYSELLLVKSYIEMLLSEATHEKLIKAVLEEEPIWNDYLFNIKGCGFLMAGVILSEVDIHKCNTVSQLNAYAGLDVVLKTDKETGELIGEGRSRKQHHLVDREYTSAAGVITKTKGITFNPFLKTKLVGVLGTSFIRGGGKYRDIYDGYKHRLQNMPAHAEKTKGHINNMAIRYMVKMFLQDLWLVWRKMEGLEVREPYAEGKLGIVHSKAA